MSVEIAPRAPADVAKMDPQALIAKALEAGATIDVVERLVALAKDVRAEQARAAWHEALTRFKRDCEPIHKDREASIEGRYTYTYASLPAILAHIEPTLAACGLTVTWRGAEAPVGHVGSRCIVAHVMGHSEDSGVVIVPVEQGARGASPAQKVGIAKTYARRYALLDALGMAPDDDDDASDHAEPATKATPGIDLGEIAARDKLWIQIQDISDAAGLSPDARKQIWQERCGTTKKIDATSAQLAEVLADVKKYAS